MISIHDEVMEFLPQRWEMGWDTSFTQAICTLCVCERGGGRWGGGGLDFNDGDCTYTLGLLYGLSVFLGERW